MITIQASLLEEELKKKYPYNTVKVCFDFDILTVLYKPVRDYEPWFEYNPDSEAVTFFTEELDRQDLEFILDIIYIFCKLNNTQN